METEKYLGIDIGGTNVKVCVLDENGTVFERNSYPTEGDRPYKDVLDNILTKCKQIPAIHESIKAIGIGICGPTDFEQGLLITSPILKSWKNVPVARVFGEALSVPVVVDNDANLAIYGETVYGAGKGLRDIIGFTLGTGVGGGVILNRQVLRGTHFFGGELGHMTVNTNGAQCNCGNHGCLTVEAAPDRISSRYFEETGAKEDVQRIFELAWGQNEQALRAIDFFIEAVATGVANVLNIFDPDCVILAGGIARSGNSLLTAISTRVKPKVFPELFAHARIALAELGEFSGAMGAAALAQETALG